MKLSAPERRCSRSRSGRGVSGALEADPASTTKLADLDRYVCLRRGGSSSSGKVHAVGCLRRRLPSVASPIGLGVREHDIEQHQALE
jgi:hypothetical protein